jgi:hypothetical protein
VSVMTDLTPDGLWNRVDKMPDAIPWGERARAEQVLAIIREIAPDMSYSAELMTLALQINIELDIASGRTKK